MMKLLALATAALISSPAFAADAIDELPPVPGPEIVDTYDWSGFYAGVQAGYGFGSTGELRLSPFTFAGLITAFTPAGAPPGSSYTGKR